MLVDSHHRAIECDFCNLWSRMVKMYKKCSAILHEYNHLQTKDAFDFLCSHCVMSELPFLENAHFDNTQTDNDYSINFEPDHINQLG